MAATSSVANITNLALRRVAQPRYGEAGFVFYLARSVPHSLKLMLVGRQAVSQCLTFPEVPQGTWHSKLCQTMLQKEKSVERNPTALAAGRNAGVDPIEQITNRCIRIVSTMESEPVCVLCSAHDSTRSVPCLT